VLGEHVRVPLAELVQQAHRALYVREEQGDGSAWKLPHAHMIAPGTGPANKGRVDAFTLPRAGNSSCVASRDTRREQNQKLFRMGNERLSDVIDDRLPRAARVPFLCECADESCDGRVELDRGQWEIVAAKPNQFVMVPGHARSEGEIVVGALDGYDVVRKPA
jgi:hypothetical protein